MKAILHIAVAASLAAGVAAQPHAQHRHQHHVRTHNHHPRLVQLQRRSEGAVVRTRDVEVVYDSTVTVYVLGGEVITAEEAEACLREHLCEVVGETEPSHNGPPPQPPATPSPLPSPPPKADPPQAVPPPAAFFEVKVHAESTKLTQPLETPAPEPKPAPKEKEPPEEKPSVVKEPAKEPPKEEHPKEEHPKEEHAKGKEPPNSYSSGSVDIDSDFPDGVLDCDKLPTEYGLVAADHVKNKGWAGVLNVGSENFVVGSVKAIVDFSAPTGGLKPGMLGTYQCAEGYDMAQWPEGAQGATGQSVGGIFCGTDNKLHLTRPQSTKKLCQKGAGNVKVINKLREKVSICKTAYPGKEDMVLANVVQGGATYNLYNPFQNTSYKWKGATTSAQYYVNPKGLDKDIACQWDSPAPYASSAGNWAGVNLGTSVDEHGTTYLSIFHNLPTSNAALDFDIKLSGDVSQECTYSCSSNSFSPSSGNGCTVAAKAGGTIYVTLFN